ncbi:MAG: pyridoxamine 5'-phosphate oxidase family protein [Oscillospiraceae bacterium]|nr:pyridoxamine 5'-phosphate oxidase family protein [Oscillospiraceae bacterium]
MRRNDREITDISAIVSFIEKEKIIRIAFYDDGDIYIVPVNYGYINENGVHTFYFHGAKAGRKFELAKASPKVGFEIDGCYELLEADIACDFSARFESVIGTGRLSLVEDRSEKIKGLDALMKQTTERAGWSYNDAMLSGVAVFRLDVEKMSCKAK